MARISRIELRRIRIIGFVPGKLFGFAPLRECGCHSYLPLRFLPLLLAELCPDLFLLSGFFAVICFDAAGLNLSYPCYPRHPW
jgi:hypothetical protein